MPVCFSIASATVSTVQGGARLIACPWYSIVVVPSTALAHSLTISCVSAIRSS
jgi:hypothetical protein